MIRKLGVEIFLLSMSHRDVWYLTQRYSATNLWDHILRHWNYVFWVTNYHVGKININLIVLIDLWSWKIWSKINCLTKKTLKFGSSVKWYSDRFSAIKSLNLIGFWILKMRLIRRDDLQPLEMIDLTC